MISPDISARPSVQKAQKDFRLQSTSGAITAFSGLTGQQYWIWTRAVPCRVVAVQSELQDQASLTSDSDWRASASAAIHQPSAWYDSKVPTARSFSSTLAMELVRLFLHRKPRRGFLSCRPEHSQPANCSTRHTWSTSLHQIHSQSVIREVGGCHHQLALVAVAVGLADFRFLHHHV